MVNIKKKILILNFVRRLIKAVSIMHKGDYAGLPKAYAYAFKWIEENGYQVLDNPRESYIDGIWNKESKDEWLTELQIPVTK